MTRLNKRRSLWSAIGLALVAMLSWTLRPEPLLVEVASVSRGTVRSTVNAEGRTRVKALYTVSAPVDGELERIVFEPGAMVTPDTVVARIRPLAPRPLDARGRAEATAAIASAHEAVARSEANEQEAAVAVEHVESKLATTHRLADTGSVPAADLEHGGHEVAMARQNLESARASVRQARADLARASAALAPIGTDGAPVIEVRSPARGQILRVLHESAGPVAAASPLLEIGDTKQLEIAADLLSSDAASVRAGVHATLSGWGGRPLSALVRRVEPAGFSKVSALGLEEQRVRVVLDLTEPLPEGLGHDYRVDVAIGVWEGRSVLRAPSTALFREGDRWAVFAVRDGRARLAHVESGPSDASFTVIQGGLAQGEQVIPQPSDAIRDGTRVGVLREIDPPQ